MGKLELMKRRNLKRNKPSLPILVENRVLEEAVKNFQRKLRKGLPNGEENERKVLKVCTLVVSTSTQTVPILTFDAESQSYNLPNQSFENIEWKRLHRRKHHKDWVQIRIEPEDLEET